MLQAPTDAPRTQPSQMQNPFLVLFPESNTITWVLNIWAHKRDPFIWKHKAEYKESDSCSTLGSLVSRTRIDNSQSHQPVWRHVLPHHVTMKFNTCCQNKATNHIIILCSIESIDFLMILEPTWKHLFNFKLNDIHCVWRHCLMFIRCMKETSARNLTHEMHFVTQFPQASNLQMWRCCCNLQLNIAAQSNPTHAVKTTRITFHHNERFVDNDFRSVPNICLHAPLNVPQAHKGNNFVQQQEMTPPVRQTFGLQLQFLCMCWPMKCLTKTHKQAIPVCHLVQNATSCEVETCICLAIRSKHMIAHTTSNSASQKPENPKEHRFNFWHGWKTKLN